MYDDLRQVTLTGGLTKDSELKYTNSGTAILNINLGCSESRKDQSGEWQRKSHYFEVSVWGKYAEALQNKLAKGVKVAVSGQLDFQQWEQDGNKRSKIVVKAEKVEILSKSNEVVQNANNSYQNNNAGGYQNNNNGNFEDNIPF